MLTLTYMSLMDQLFPDVDTSQHTLNITEKLETLYGKNSYPYMLVMNSLFDKTLDVVVTADPATVG